MYDVGYCLSPVIGINEISITESGDMHVWIAFTELANCFFEYFLACAEEIDATLGVRII